MFAWDQKIFGKVYEFHPDRGFYRKTILFSINLSNLVFLFFFPSIPVLRNLFTAIDLRASAVPHAVGWSLSEFAVTKQQRKNSEKPEKNRGQKHEKGKFLLNDSRTCFNRVAKWIFLSSYTSISICRIHRSLIRYIDFLLCFSPLFAASSLSSWLIKQDVNAESSEGRQKRKHPKFRVLAFSKIPKRWKS